MIQMPETSPFHYECDGEGCNRSIGDVGAFLWHFDGDLCFCGKCWEKRQAGKLQCPNCGEKINIIKGEGDKDMMVCNRCGIGESKDKFRVK